jgi:hypothetical protein
VSKQTEIAVECGCCRDVELSIGNILHSHSDSEDKDDAVATHSFSRGSC